MSHDDLPAKLRNFYAHAGSVAGHLPLIAADRIEAQAARIAELESALREANDMLQKYILAPALTDDEIRSIYRHVFSSPFLPQIYGLAKKFARAIERAIAEKP
jgi:hypothetical protein